MSKRRFESGEASVGAVILVCVGLFFSFFFFTKHLNNELRDECAEKKGRYVSGSSLQSFCIEPEVTE